MSNVATSLHHTPLGAYALPDEWKSDDIVQDIQRGVLHGWRVAEAMVRWWEPETAILDVGCNLGQMSVCVARATQRIARTSELTRAYAIEARPILANLARQNFELNGIDGSVTLGAAWDEPDISLPLSDIDFENFGSVGSLGIARPNSLTLESAPSIVLDECKFSRRISVVKLDIQGSEYRALLGSRQTIREHLPVIIFEFEEMFAPQFGIDFSAYIDLLASMNYRIREVCGSNNYVAISNARFETHYKEHFSHRRRRTNREAFFNLVSL